MSQRLRLLPVPIPSSVAPGIISQSAKSGPWPDAEATVVTGCGVVVRFRVVDCGPLSVSVLDVKLHAAPDGGALQVRETLAPKTGCGDNCTVYCAIWPAATVRLEGLMVMENPPA